MPIPRPCADCGRRTFTTRCPPGEGCAVTGRRVARPCANCGAPTRHGDYCAAPGCALFADGRGHYKGDYQRRAAKLRARWNADPRTRCWICGHGARPGDPWTADHVQPGNPRSELRPAHESCNSARGAPG